jgi:hypothetical protein
MLSVDQRTSRSGASVARAGGPGLRPNARFEIRGEVESGVLQQGLHPHPLSLCLALQGAPRSIVDLENHASYSPRRPPVTQEVGVFPRRPARLAIGEVVMDGLPQESRSAGSSLELWAKRYTPEAVELQGDPARHADPPARPKPRSG